MKISPQNADIYSSWAEEFYNPEQAYHNWGHAEEVMAESLALLEHNPRVTKGVNRPLLQIGAAWHDAGHDYPERFEHASSEHYSVYLMRQRLAGVVSEDELREMEKSILGTRYRVVRDSMSSVALHYGDVGNMMHKHDSFLDHSTRLWVEYGRPDWEEWKTQALGVIATTIQEGQKELPTIGVTDSGPIIAMYMNLARLRFEEEPKA